MPPPLELLLSTAVRQARMVRERELSAVELLSVHLEQIEAVNPRVNAIVTLVADAAMEEARAADAAHARGDDVGPLHGLPIAVKDLADTRGIRTTYGSPLFADHVPDADSLLEQGIVDSLGVLEIVTFIESEFNVTLSDGTLNRMTWLGSPGFADE